jgi:ROK family
VVFNTSRLKQINLDLIRSALKSEDYSTKNSLSGITGLSVASCKNILGELLQSGEVKEIELASSTGGRPSRRFVYNKNYAFVLLMYIRIEGTQQTIYSSLVNMLGEQVTESFEDFEQITVKEIDQTIGGLLDEYPGIKVISMGIPGIVNNGMIDSCDIEALNNIPILEYLSEKFKRDVTVENDVNFTALGYYQRLEKDNPESLVYIYYPQDGMSGAGIIVNGKVLKGRTNFAGEVSYMPVWVEREEQGRVQKNTKIFSELVADIVLSINCLINPECIVLSGQWFTEDLKKAIENSVIKASQPGHSPRISFEQDIHFSYVDGLRYSGMHKLSCGFEIVEN